MGSPTLCRWAAFGDWTDGCIAVSNAEIEEIWSLVGDGTPIEIRP
jgi:lipoprotein-anchoring transpeptidase ErfK/SrfK